MDGEIIEFEHKTRFTQIIISSFHFNFYIVMMIQLYKNEIPVLNGKTETSIEGIYLLNIITCNIQLFTLLSI